jgi:hypothetical protein
VILTSAPSIKGIGTGSHNGARYSYYVKAQIGSGPSGKGGAEMGITLTSVDVDVDVDIIYPGPSLLRIAN